MKTSEELRETLEQGIQSNLDFRDAEHDQILEQLWVVVHETHSALTSITDRVDSSKLDDKDFTCLLMLTNCFVDTLASYQNLRAGFHRAAAIVARGMLENLAMSVAMKSDEKNEIFNWFFRLSCA